MRLGLSISMKVPRCSASKKLSSPSPTGRRSVTTKPPPPTGLMSQWRMLPVRVAKRKRAAWAGESHASNTLSIATLYRCVTRTGTFGDMRCLSPPRKGLSIQKKLSSGHDAITSSLAVRQFDLDLQHLEVVVPVEIHLDVVRIDLDVLADHRHQVALQSWKVVRLARVAARAFVREDDLQPLHHDRSEHLHFAEQEGKQACHQRPPNKHTKKPPFCASTKRIGLSLPRKRSMTSL